MENLCSSERDGIGFPSLEITERLIPAHLTMLDEKECYSSHPRLGWHASQDFLRATPSGNPSENPRSDKTAHTHIVHNI